MDNIIKEQLIRDINKTKENHDKLKNEISILLDDMVNLEKEINNKIEKLNETEKKYVELIEMFSNNG